jgi:hypothetical protein
MPGTGRVDDALLEASEALERFRADNPWAGQALDLTSQAGINALGAARLMANSPGIDPAVAAALAKAGLPLPDQQAASEAALLANLGSVPPGGNSASNPPLRAGGLANPFAPTPMVHASSSYLDEYARLTAWGIVQAEGDEELPDMPPLEQQTTPEKQTRSGLDQMSDDPSNPVEWFFGTAYDVWKQTLFEPTKGTMRWLGAGLGILPDVADNTVRYLRGTSKAERPGYFGYVFGNTHLFTALNETFTDGNIEGEGLDAGSGWFMNGSMQEYLNERALDLGHDPNGNSWTVGRSLATTLNIEGAAEAAGLPGDWAYKAASGWWDLSKQILLDPTTWIAPEAKFLTATKALPGAAKAGAAAARGTRYAAAADVIRATQPKGRVWMFAAKQVETPQAVDVTRAGKKAFDLATGRSVEAFSPLDLLRFDVLREATDMRGRVSLPVIPRVPEPNSILGPKAAELREWAGTFHASSNDGDNAFMLLPGTYTGPADDVLRLRTSPRAKVATATGVRAGGADLVHIEYDPADLRGTLDLGDYRAVEEVKRGYSENVQPNATWEDLDRNVRTVRIARHRIDKAVVNGEWTADQATRLYEQADTLSDLGWVRTRGRGAWTGYDIYTNPAKQATPGDSLAGTFWKHLGDGRVAIPPEARTLDNDLADYADVLTFKVTPQDVSAFMGEQVLATREYALGADRPLSAIAGALDTFDPGEFYIVAHPQKGTGMLGGLDEIVGAVHTAPDDPADAAYVLSRDWVPPGIEGRDVQQALAHSLGERRAQRIMDRVGTVRGRVMDPEELPDVLYHVTTNSSRVTAERRLVPRFSSRRLGLAGPRHESSVSFTVSKDVADQIAQDMRFVIDSSRAGRSLKRLKVRSDGTFTRRGQQILGEYRDRLVAYADSIGMDGRRVSDLFDQQMRAVAPGESPGSRLPTIVNQMFWERQAQTGIANPLFMDLNSSWDDWARRNPDQIAVMSVAKEDVAKGRGLVTNFDVGTGSLEEVRVYGNVPVRARLDQANPVPLQRTVEEAEIPDGWSTLDGYMPGEVPRFSVKVAPTQRAMRWGAAQIVLPAKDRWGRLGEADIKRLDDTIDYLKSAGWTESTSYHTPTLDTGVSGLPDPAARSIVLTRPGLGEYDAGRLDQMVTQGDLLAQQRLEAGLADGHTRVVVPSRWSRYLDSPESQTLVDKVLDAKTVIELHTNLRRRVHPFVLGRVNEIRVALREASKGAAPETVKTLRDDAARQVKETLALAASEQMVSVTPPKLGGVIEQTLTRLPAFERKKARLLAQMPGTWLDLADPESTADGVYGWLRNVHGMPDSVIDDVMGELYSSATVQGRKSAVFAALRATREVITHNFARDMGMDIATKRADIAAAKVPGAAQDVLDRAQAWAKVDSFSQRVSQAFEKATGEQTTLWSDLLARDGGDFPFNETGLHDRTMSPALRSVGELLNRGMPMPDAKAIARLTRNGPLSKLLKSPQMYAKHKGAYDKVVDDWLEFFNTEIFKPLVLLRFAYITRIVPEETARLWAAGGPSLFSHPIHWFMSVTNKSGVLDLYGKNIEKVAEAGSLATDGDPDWVAKALSVNLRNAGNTRAVTNLSWAFRKISHEEVLKGRMTPERFSQAWAQNVWQMGGDSILRRLAGGWDPSDLAEMPTALKDTGDAVQMLDWWLTRSPRGRALLRSYADGVDDGWKMVREENRLRFLLGEQEKLRAVTGGNPEIEKMVATGRWVDNSGVEHPLTKKGHVYSVSGDFEKQMLSIYVNTATDRIPPVLKWADPDSVRGRSNVWSKAVDFAADAVIARPSRHFNRSPLFRQRYGEHLAELIPLMSTAERAKLLDSNDFGRYMRDIDDSWFSRLPDFLKDRFQRSPKREIERSIASATEDGALSMADVDMLAKKRAYRDVVDLLYEWEDRTILATALRFVVPFGTAWMEAIGTWARLIGNQPKVPRRIQQGMYALQQPETGDVFYGQSEDDIERHGLFYRDRTTGDMMFDYPFTDLLTGIPGMRLRGQVGNLNMVASVTPGFGPAVTWPAAWLMPADSPNGFAQAARQFLTLVNGGYSPEGNITSLLPAWLDKFFIAAGFENVVGGAGVRQLATAQADALAYIFGNDPSILTDPNRMAQAQADATTAARNMLLLRGLAQFSAPTVANYQYKQWVQGERVPSKMFLTQALLADEYRKYVEAYGAAADIQFIKDFGQSGLIAGLSARGDVTGLLDDDKATLDFLRVNGAARTRYPNTVGVLVPGQRGQFDIDTYSYITDAGFAEFKSVQEMSEAMSARIGRAYVKRADSYGDDSATDAVRTWVEGNYLGYSSFGEDPQRNAKNVRELSTLRSDPEYAQTVTGRAILTYLSMRDQVLVAVGDSPEAFDPDWSARRRQQGAAMLYEFGQGLASQDPNFERAWRRVFEPELRRAVGA